MKTTLRSLLAGAILFAASAVEAQTVKTGLFFEKSGSYVRIPHNNAYNFGEGEFSFEMWIQADTGQVYQPYLLYKKDTIINATGFSMGIDNNNKLILQVKGNGYNTGFGFGGVNVVDGNCHHVVWTREDRTDSSTVRCYIDGSLVNKSVKVIALADVDHNTDLYVGWTAGGGFKQDFTFHGMIKELRIWNIARSQSDIQATMDKFLAGNESGLVGNWRFYENSGTTVKDYSSIGNDGMLGGGAYEPTWQDFCDVINDVLPPTGIEVADQSSNVRIYPNPADNLLNIQVGDGRIQRVRIYNALGEIVLEQIQPTENVFNVSELDRGLYFAEVRLASNEVVTHRFMKR